MNDKPTSPIRLSLIRQLFITEEVIQNTLFSEWSNVGFFWSDLHKTHSTLFPLKLKSQIISRGGFGVEILSVIVG